MAVRIIMPKLGDFMMEGIVAKWKKSSGDQVDQGEIIAEIETEKLNYDLEATESGILHSVVAEGATVPAEDVMGYLLAEGEDPPAATAPEAAPVSTAPQTAAPSKPRPSRAPGDVVPSTPGARKLAAKLGVDLAQVTPTGPRGRIVEADVRTYAEQQPGAAPKAPTIPLGLPEPSKTVKMESMRKGIAEHMRMSLASTAQLTYHLEVDVTEAQRLRREVSRESDTVVALAHVLTKACAEAIKRVPALNTVLVGDSILFFDEVNIGVAVALDEGLIVPVVRNVESKDVFQISRDTDELADKAREGKLLPDEVVGGTFSISVLGSVDGFTPVLSRGQSALLGVGRTLQKPVVRSGEIVVREMVNLSLTVDHQTVDGAVAASFMRRLQQMIERPAALFK